MPWEIAFLPSGAALVSERSSGRILRVLPKRRPGPRGDGGTGRRSERRRGRLARAGALAAVPPQPDGLRLPDHRARQPHRPLSARRPPEADPDRARASDASTTAGGSRSAPDGMLYVGVGDAGDTERGSGSRRAQRQDPADRSPTAASPATTRSRSSPVWSLGHRNVQGLAWDRDGRLWATEFGQNRLDEVNLIRPRAQLRLARGRGARRHAGRQVHQPAGDLVDRAEASPSGAAIRGRTLYVAALRGERLYEDPAARQSRRRARSRV